MEHKACAITGHRPTRFKWKYNENNNGCKRLQNVLVWPHGIRITDLDTFSLRYRLPASVQAGHLVFG